MDHSIRTLVVGAGAVGGYFGGRLLESGADVTFLARPRRAEELAAAGLRIESRAGNLTIPNPPTIVAESLTPRFGLVLLSCKAYDLENAMASFAPAVGPGTMIVPLLNGMRHLDMLAERFGPEQVLGGVCFIAATLGDHGQIVHLNDLHTISFGERDGKLSERVQAVDRLMSVAQFDHSVSPNILLTMWEKWVFLAALAGATCLFRASVGDICAAPGGRDFVLELLEECRSIAASQGYPPGEPALQRAREALTAAGSPMTASMLRDLESGGPIEADHVIGDLMARGRSPLLSIAYTALKAYERRRTIAPPRQT